MITASIKINRPSGVVWDYFTTTSNWSKWYGGGLKEVAPAWQQGASLVWELGGASPIVKFIPGRQISLAGRWMDTTYEFLPEGNSATLLKVVESDPKGGAVFTDGGASHKSQQEQALQKFKKVVEADCNASSEPPASAESLILAIKDESVPMNFEFKSDARQEVAVKALVQIGATAVEPLIAAMNGGKLEGHVASPVTYTYYVKALGGIGDPRAVKPLLALRDDVDLNMGLPNIFADLVMPRYRHLREAINVALTTCQKVSSPIQRSAPPEPVKPVIPPIPVARSVSELDSCIKRYTAQGYGLVSRTGTSATLSTRAPISVFILLVLVFIFPIGAIIYVLARKKYQVQLVQESDGRVTESGGSLEEYERDRAREAKRPPSGIMSLLLGVVIAALGGLLGLILLLSHLSDPVLSKDPAGTVMTLLVCPTPIVAAGVLAFAAGLYVLRRAARNAA